MTESPLFWPARLENNTLLVLDETQLPHKLHYISVKNTAQAVKVIKEMKTRAFGQFLVVLNTFLLELNNVGNGLKPFPTDEELFTRFQNTADALNASRPTFPFSEVTSIVIGWAKQSLEQNLEMKSFLEKNIQGFLKGIRMKRLKRVSQIAEVIKDGDAVLTHCNVSGELAMAARICQEQKKDVHFFATETRPYFQGAKLTCWELDRAGAKVTLIADNAVGSLMADGLIDCVIIGSDRSCANGDIANKIGSYQIAVLAKEFDIPLYVLTQPSNKIPTGEDIPIELRDPDELLMFEGSKIFSDQVKGFYPGFDVVPHALIAGQLAVDPSGRYSSSHI